LSLALLQALDQKEAEDMMRLLQGGSFKEALMQQREQCCSFVDAAEAITYLKSARALLLSLCARRPPPNSLLLIIRYLSVY
jgi:hypothetical protein